MILLLPSSSLPLSHLTFLLHPPCTPPLSCLHPTSILPASLEVFIWKCSEISLCYSADWPFFPHFGWFSGVWRTDKSSQEPVSSPVLNHNGTKASLKWQKTILFLFFSHPSLWGGGNKLSSLPSSEMKRPWGLASKIINQWSKISEHISFPPPASIYIKSNFGHTHILKIDFGLRRFPSEVMKKIRKLKFNTLGCTSQYFCSEIGDVFDVFKCFYSSILCVQWPLYHCMHLHVKFNHPFTMFLFVL